MASRFRSLTKGVGMKLVKQVAGTIRAAGQSLDKMGAKLEVAKHSDKLVPSTKFVAVDGMMPSVSSINTFIAPNASLVGGVNVDKESSVWYGAILRADDVNTITVGKRSHIMDKAMIYANTMETEETEKSSGDGQSSSSYHGETKIGNNVIIGGNTIIYSNAVLNDGCLIGESCVICSNVLVESNTIIQPGSIVAENTVVQAGELWGGNPAIKIRDLVVEEKAAIVERSHITLQLAANHYLENYTKSYEDVKHENEFYDHIDKLEDMSKPLNAELYDQSTSEERHEVLGMGLPGRIFNSSLTNPEEGLEIALRYKYGHDKSMEDIQNMKNVVPPEPEDTNSNKNDNKEEKKKEQKEEA